MKIPDGDPDHPEHKNHWSGKQTKETIRRVTVQITDFDTKKKYKKDKQEGTAIESITKGQFGKRGLRREQQERENKRESTEINTRTRDILDVLGKQWFDVQEARNKTEHGRTQTAQTQQRQNETVKKTMDIHDRNSGYLISEQALLQDTAEEYIAMTGLITRQTWVGLWAPVFAQKTHRRRTLSLRGVPSRWIFFQPPAPV